MIDLFTLALTHGLMALALWRMLFRPDLDLDEGEARPAARAWHKPPPAPADEAGADA